MRCHRAHGEFLCSVEASTTTPADPTIMALPAFPAFEVNLDSNIGPRWEKWLTRFERLMTAMAITDVTRKRAMLLHYAGTDVDEIFDTLTIEEATGDATEYSVATAALNAYFTPKANTAFEVYNFRQATQKGGENMDAFATRLRQLAKSCGFADDKIEIANQIIFSCKSQSLRRRALRDNLNLDDLIKLARSLEISETQAKTVEASNSDTVNFMKDQHQSRDKRQQSRSNSQSYRRSQSSHHANGRSQSRRRPDNGSRRRNNTGKCYYCGYNLPHLNCPARGKTCAKCGKRDHFAQVCKSSSSNMDNPSHHQANVVSNVSNYEESDDEREYIWTATTRNSSRRLPSCSVKIGRTAIPVQMTIDSGASVNILDQATYDGFPERPPLESPSSRIYSYGSSKPLPVLGVVHQAVSYDSKTLDTKLHVVKGSGGNLLGCRAAQDLGILLLANAVQENPKSSTVPSHPTARKFPQLFDGIGKIKDKMVRLHIDEDVRPKQHVTAVNDYSRVQ
ncbi:PREDICTED: uncharacterized protein LOC106818534 [Priapulus caudatus]|uniref:Uncharacterized protein LOC106818534 n=1 Tax=Priapulus caudatus TaxID=37621 RepID=A0ABM1F2P8_PRICU|nr:PREDICTED: uncharacterized protein LOC106818534 [Priapulus caudatus]